MYCLPTEDGRNNTLFTPISKEVRSFSLPSTEDHLSAYKNQPPKRMRFIFLAQSASV